MGEKHFRSRIPHHLADPFPHILPITVDGTFGAGGFILDQRAIVYPLHGIVVQRLAIRAETVGKAVLVAAVNSCHDPQGMSFALDSIFLHGYQPWQRNLPGNDGC